jgi:hypothetical protein
MGSAIAVIGLAPGLTRLTCHIWRHTCLAGRLPVRQVRLSLRADLGAVGGHDGRREGGRHTEALQDG